MASNRISVTTVERSSGLFSLCRVLFGFKDQPLPFKSLGEVLPLISGENGFSGEFELYLTDKILLPETELKEWGDFFTFELLLEFLETIVKPEQFLYTVPTTRTVSIDGTYYTVPLGTREIHRTKEGQLRAYGKFGSDCTIIAKTYSTRNDFTPELVWSLKESTKFLLKELTYKAVTTGTSVVDSNGTFSLMASNYPSIKECPVTDCIDVTESLEEIAKEYNWVRLELLAYRDTILSVFKEEGVNYFGVPNGFLWYKKDSCGTIIFK